MKTRAVSLEATYLPSRNRSRTCVVDTFESAVEGHAQRGIVNPTTLALRHICSLIGLVRAGRIIHQDPTGR